MRRWTPVHHLGAPILVGVAIGLAALSAYVTLRLYVRT